MSPYQSASMRVSPVGVVCGACALLTEAHVLHGVRISHMRASSQSELGRIRVVATRGKGGELVRGVGPFPKEGAKVKPSMAKTG